MQLFSAPNLTDSDVRSLRQVTGVIFDMDGTLVLSDLDFARIRAEAEVPEEQSVLDYLETAPEKKRRKAERVLRTHERRAARDCSLHPDVPRLLAVLREEGFRLGLLTRNCRDSVTEVLNRFDLRFDCCLSREDAPPKPAPAPVRKMARMWDLRPEETMVVGDYIFDLHAGREAGAVTVLIRSERNTHFAEEADIVIDRPLELLEHLLPETDPQTTCEAKS
jgi:HAD superfamily hydrolase (TIGR01509 family)